MISAAHVITKANAILEIHFLFVGIAADKTSAAAKKPASRAVGGDGTRIDEEGTCANQWMDANSVPIKKLRMCPSTIPRPFHAAPRTIDTNPNGTITPVSSTAGMFASGAVKEPPTKTRATHRNNPISKATQNTAHSHTP